jgi:hypothetical protein
MLRAATSGQGVVRCQERGKRLPAADRSQKNKKIEAEL